MSFPTFDAFYQQIYQRSPLPWQTALAEQVAASDWPGTVSVPTGLGKTTTLAIAVWNLARQVAAGGERTAPLRMLHVVDRAVIVDQTHGDITILADALHRAADEQDETPVARVAGVLAERFGNPLVTGRMHGAHYDDEWLSVHQPALVTMTAHQATSRALFRGFSVSQSMSPVHAALVGLDSLILVDEPHLSAASVHTLRAVKHHQQGAEPVGVPVGQVVQLGASLPSSDEDTAGLTEQDRAHPVGRARLSASKTLSTSPVAGTDKAVTTELARLARAELDTHPDRAVAVVVNTVDAARQVHRILTSGKHAVDGLLVTSRIRGRERRHINNTLAEGDWRLVVATQTIEAGVDLTVDTLVTETCGWQALTQRLGRLNRYGTSTGRAFVVTTPTPRPGTTAVYGDTATHVGTLLEQLGSDVDVSPDGLATIQEHHAELVAAATEPQPAAPTLIRELLPTLAHTRPRPAADVDIQPFITGIRDTPARPDVTVLWRTHLEPEVADGMPPTPDETVTVPVAAINTLLRSRITGTRPAEPALSDVGESAPAGTTQWSVSNGGQAPALVATPGGDWTRPVDSAQISPGSTVVLHNNLGGHDHTGWNPHATEPVCDLSPAHAVESGRWWLCSIDTLTILHQQGYLAGPPEPTLLDLLLEADLDQRDELAGKLLPDELGELDLGPIQQGVGIWVRAARTPAEQQQYVALTDHAAHVATTAAHITSTIGVSTDLATRIEWAAYRHDDGKTDPGFQAMLGATPSEPALAKPHPHQPGIARAIPHGWRHEALSAQQVLDEHADDLVTHLVAAHHGWARPLLPPADGPGHNLATADRFHQLNHRFGPWGLAWAETLVRLADHTASAHPETGHTPPAGPMPQHPSPTQTEHQGQLPLTGVPIDSHMAWWAVAGALVAATDLDPHTTIRFSTSPAGPLAVLATTADQHAIASQVVTIRNQVAYWGQHQPKIRAENEKLPTQWNREILASLDRYDHRDVVAALVDDTQPAPASGTPVRAPWHPSNSTLIGTALSRAHPAETIAAALDTDNPDHHDRGHHFGMMPSELYSAVITGIGHDGRSVLHPLVLAAAARLPSTGNPRPAGTTRDGKRHLPIPHVPVTWTGLLALLQTLPPLANRAWHTVGIDHLEHVETRPNEGRTKAWVHA